jgi:hypothetical protein
LFELRSSEFERFSQSSVSFLSEAGVVLTFFCFVFCVKTKNEEDVKLQSLLAFKQKELSRFETALYLCKK